MRRQILIAVILCWASFCGFSAQPGSEDGGYADPSYYLIDSLKLNALSSEDRDLLDSCLSKYHKSKEDTARLTALSFICNYLQDDNWFRYQLIQYEILKEFIANNKDASIHDKYQTRLADAVNNIGLMYHGRGKMDEAIAYYLRSLAIYQGLEDIKGIAYSYLKIGLVYDNRGDIAISLDYYQKSLETYRTMSELPNEERARVGSKGVAAALNNIGLIYMHQGDIEKGLDYYHQSIKIEEEIGNKIGEAASLNNIGHIYLNQGDTANGLKYFRMSLKIKEALDDQLGIAISLNNVGSVYELRGDLDQALYYFNKSLSIKQKLEDKEGVATTLNNIGHILRRQGEATQALEKYNQALALFEEIVEQLGMTISYYNIGSAYFDLGDKQKARTYALKSLEMAKGIGFPDQIKRAAILLSKVYRGEGKYEDALEMYELFVQMGDSIKNDETEKATIRQQTKYEFEKAILVQKQEKKEALRIEAEQTSRRDNIQYSIIFISLLVLFGGVLFMGFIKVSDRMAEGIIFFSFLIFFEFLLVLADPYIEEWSGGAPGIKLLFNAGVAGLIFPLHAFFEDNLKARLAN